jgi:hypothetical protein
VFRISATSAEAAEMPLKSSDDRDHEKTQRFRMDVWRSMERGTGSVAKT